MTVKFKIYFFILTHCPNFRVHYIGLYLKSYQSSDPKRTLNLIGTQINQGKETLLFSYWIPNEYQNQKVSLIDTLEALVNQFGLKLKIGNDEGYFFRKSSRLVSGEVENPLSLVSFIGPNQIPNQCFLSTSENQIEGLNYVSLYYTFALNIGKYLFWLNSYPKVSLEIKSGWYDFVKQNLVEFIQPNGKTKITIQSQRDTQSLQPDQSDNQTSIEVPKIYEHQFRHVIDKINALKNGEKIIFGLSFHEPTCLFCPSNDISKEHIFPKWIRPYVEETTFEGANFSKFGDEDFSKVISSSTTKGKKESSHGYTVKLACIDCNSGWMSNLEEEIKNILIINNELIKTISEEIDPINAYKLSLWLIMKALLLSNKTFSNIHGIEESVFTNLKNGIIDEGFLVEFITAINPKFDFMVNKGPLLDEFLELDKIPRERGKEMALNFFSCSIQLNHLLFRISFLNKHIPLERETILKPTFKLFPLRDFRPHRNKTGNAEQWAKIIQDKLELSVFGAGLLLKERKIVEKPTVQ
jgi:hypothetical protein